MVELPSHSDYTTFIAEIKERIYNAHYEAIKSVCKEQILLYWDIGNMIVEKQQQQGWGKSVVEQIARDLQTEFPGVHGLSSHNLWRMRKFYLYYSQNQFLAPLVQEIGFALHYKSVKKIDIETINKP
jgi:hypothetical protein